MATLSNNAASWYKPSMGGSRPASNGGGFGSGRAGASARRFLRSAAGGAAAVGQQYKAYDRQNDYDRQDQLQRRGMQIEANKKAADIASFEKWKKEGGIGGGQQERTPTMGPATRESANYMSNAQSNTAPVNNIATGPPLQPRAPAGTRTNPTTGAMSAPSLTPSIGLPQVQPRAGATFEGKPAAQFFQESANRQDTKNRFAKPSGAITDWQPRGDLRSAGENLANLQAGGFQQQVPPMAPDSALPPPTAFAPPTAAAPTQSQAPSLDQAGAAINSLGGSVPAEPQYEMISPAGEMARGVSRAINTNIIAPIANKASELGGTASQNLSRAGQNISDTMGKLKGEASTILKPTVAAYDSAKKFMTPVKKLK